MQDAPHWDDLRLFAAVARAGSLARAVDETGASQATLSRRMRALEEALGQSLFRRGNAGYALTGEGRALAARVATMEEAASGISRPLPERVRISAGTWTALDLAAAMDRIWRPGTGWVPEFVQAERMLDIARREADIGIRNRAPDQPWLAGRRVGYVDYAVFATDESVTSWIGAAEGATAVPSARWIAERHGPRIVTRASTPVLAATLAEAGIGRIVLPVFIGARRPALTRISPPIAELRSEEWLVSHHEGRHLPPVRCALAALARYLRSRSA